MLHFNSLVLETIDRCNARCDMCYQAAGPKGSDIRGDRHLPLDVTLRVVSEAIGLPELAEPRLHLSGGEGFINYSEMLTIFRHAAAVGFEEIGATTNAFWARVPRRAGVMCSELRAAGVTYLEISLDHWHLPYVDLSAVRNLLRATRAAGIRAILRLLSSRSHHMGELMQHFEPRDLIHAQVANSRVQLVGRAHETLSAADVYYARGVEGSCDQFLNLTVTPNGNVYPCCAGADMTREMASGNVLRESLVDAVLKMSTDHMIRSVIHRGAGDLIPIVRSLGFADRLKDRYASICQLCWDVFRDDEMAAALRKHFAEEHFQMLVTALRDRVAA